MADTVVAFDLDGTVTRDEILPILARELGLEREMEVLTDLTLSGHIPFEDSFRLRCAILKAVPISRVQNVVSGVPLSPDIVDFIRSRPQRCAIITGNLDVWVRPILNVLGCHAYTSRSVTDHDRLVGVKSVLTKADAVDGLRRTFSRVVAVGDSMNDVSMFEASDVGVAYGGVHSPVAALVAAADYLSFEEGSLCRLLSTLS